MLRRILNGLVILAIAGVALVSAAYQWDMHLAYERVRGKSAVVSSPYGQIEYTEGGSGPAVLVVHGSGGGYDQGELIEQAVLDGQFHWIAPSRFGYLRSTLHEGATWDDQAHAFAFLLDRLGLKKVAVVAMSQGGPSALLFAVLHPKRISSLTLVSCGVSSSSATDQGQADKKGRMLTAIYRHDPYYWAATRLFKKQFMRLMGADDAVIAGLTPRQRTLAEQVIDFMNPASLRSAGAAFDNRAAMPNDRIVGVRAPTLILHATDDTLQLYRNAVFAAAAIPDAKLVNFERGGHLLMIVEQAAVRAAVQKHILGHLGERPPKRP